MKKFEQDFTKEPLGKQILWFSIPLVCSNLLHVLFNMADIAVVGQVCRLKFARLGRIHNNSGGTEYQGGIA